MEVEGWLSDDVGTEDVDEVVGAGEFVGVVEVLGVDEVVGFCVFEVL